MSSSKKAIAVAWVFGLSACASADPTRPPDITSTALMSDRIAPGEDVGARFEYRKGPEALAAYRSIRLDPVEIRRGDGFARLAEPEVRGLAERLGREVAVALAARRLVAERRGPDVLRLRLVLTAAEPTVPGLATLTRVTPAGFALAGVRSLGGVEGGFTGSVAYVAEFRDEATGELIWAFVAKAFPVALDIPASLGRLTAAEAGIHRAAAALATRLAADLAPRE